MVREPLEGAVGDGRSLPVWAGMPRGLGPGPKLSEQAGCGGHWLICTLSIASSSSLP